MQNFYLIWCAGWSFIGSIILLWITRKIFTNLYIKRHNWIIEPSSTNKIYALLTPLLCLISYITWIIIIMLFILTYIDETNYLKWTLINSSVSILGNFTYFMYMISTLQYQMKAEPLMKQAISNKILIFIKCLLYLDLARHAIANYLNVLCDYANVYRGIPYYLISWIFGVILKIFCEILLCKLYISGLNNVAHFWCSRYWKEYEKYGENEKTHQLMIIMTRCTIIVIISIICTILMYFFNIICQYILLPDADVMIYFIGNEVAQLSAILDNITYGLSVYFVYDFAYNDYLYCCSKCHNKMYKYFEMKHQKEVKMIGTFDGNKCVLNQTLINN